MIETFTREQFEQALPTHKETGEPLWKYTGLVQGEHAYRIPIPETNKRIMIRSSVRRNDKSASTGKDSIRLWVEYHYRKVDKWFALGKLDAWTTRKPGWQDRMTGKLRKLWRLALEDGKNGSKTQVAPAARKCSRPQNTKRLSLNSSSLAQDMVSSKPLLGLEKPLLSLKDSSSLRQTTR